mmetsp:Transcript_15283/g.45783  ORF Transcript_15283/g.45783 Transcript_15283/m.45783 type:complete len:272 (+) Transcript_15283:52-867(+)
MGVRCVFPWELRGDPTTEIERMQAHILNDMHGKLLSPWSQRCTLYKRKSKNSTERLRKKAPGASSSPSPASAQFEAALTQELYVMRYDDDDVAVLEAEERSRVRGGDDATRSILDDDVAACARGEGIPPFAMLPPLSSARRHYFYDGHSLLEAGPELTEILTIGQAFAESLIVQIKGQIFQVGDFRVRIGQAILTKTALRAGTLIEVEYCPCLIPAHGQPILMEFINTRLGPFATEIVPQLSFPTQLVSHHTYSNKHRTWQYLQILKHIIK